jgi:DNA-binding response OmpR family regulator
MPGSDNKARALLVEDQFLLGLAMRDLLIELGLDVVGPARGLDEANWLLDEHPDLDVAVLDVYLGAEMIWPLARELRKRSIPFVFMTGDNLVDLPADLTGSIVLVRPFEDSVLRTTIEGLLSESGNSAKSVM